jgi:tetratricopeptide (TPR) repeat protein
MFVRPNLQIAQWLSASAVGATVSLLLRETSGMGGAAPGHLLSVILGGVIIFGIARSMPPPGAHWRFGLIFPVFAFLGSGPMGQAASTFLRTQTGTTVLVPVLAAATWVVCLWPSARIAATATRSNPGRLSPLAFAAGIWAGTFEPLLVMAAVACALFISDLVHPTERGHTRHKQRSVGQLAWVPLLVGMWMSGGWVQLRTVLDPSVMGLIVVLAGIGIGRTVAPTWAAGSTLWLGLLAALLWGSHHIIPTGAPQLAAAGMNGLGGVHPTLWLALPLFFWGMCTSIVLPSQPWNKAWPWVLLATGIGLGPSLFTHTSTPWIAVGSLGLAALFSSAGISRTVGLAAGIGLVLFEGWVPSPDAGQSRIGVWAAAHSPRALAHWTAAPSGMARVQHGSTPKGTFVTWNDDSDDGGLRIAVDGHIRSTQGKAAQAEEMAGHLSALLSHGKEPVLLLNDQAGNVLRGISAHPDRIVQVAAASPASLRSIAALDPIRKRLWLEPNHPLYPEHGSALLRRMPKVPTIVEVSSAPWADSANGAMNSDHIRTIRAHLQDDGMYVMAMHLRWWPDGGPASIASALLEEFAHVQAWLPPQGVDTLIFIASDTAPAFLQLKNRFAHAATALGSLGFTTAESLAGSAVLGTSGVTAWAGAAAKPTPADRLPTAVFERPTLHLGSFPGWMNEHPKPWVDGASVQVQQTRLARKSILEMLHSAATGHIEGAFEAAKRLSTDYGALGRTALEAIIAPHLKDGRTALRAASAAGPASTAWDNATRFATTARMLAPKSALPRTLQGDIAIAQGHVPKALEHYNSALAIEPAHIPALEGLARVARLLNEPVRAEQALRDATRHAPRSWRAWHNLGVFQLEQGNPGEALKAVEVATGLAPKGEVTPFLVLTQALLALDQNGAALLRSEQCVGMAPDNGIAWFLRGRAHYALGRWTEAETDFQKAVLTDSDLIEARSGIGLVRAILGDTLGATKVFRDILKRDPDNSAARENLRRLGTIPSPPEPD